MTEETREQIGLALGTSIVIATSNSSISVEQLADKLGMSPDKLWSIIMAHEDLSAIDYVRICAEIGIPYETLATVCGYDMTLSPNSELRKFLHLPDENADGKNTTVIKTKIDIHDPTEGQYHTLMAYMLARLVSVMDDITELYTAIGKESEDTET